MINICFLSHNRFEFSGLFFYFLNKIKNHNKNKIKLSILSSMVHDWDLTLLNGIEVDVKVFNNGDNYLEKINFALNTECEYSIKIDDDCYINNFIWDYIIENINYLDDDNNLLLSVLLSNTIPSCDKFIEGFITDENTKKNINDIFLKRSFPNGLWGVDYSPLNKYTINSNNWNYADFYNGVNKLLTKIKGMHPLRISFESQILINEYIINNIDNIINKHDNYSIFNIESSYFTNNFFAIKTKEWRNVMERNNNDGFDEISLNQYKEITNKKIGFISNSFSIHSYYGTILGNKNPWSIGIDDEIGKDLERIFYEKLINKIKIC